MIPSLKSLSTASCSQNLPQLSQGKKRKRSDTEPYKETNKRQCTTHTLPPVMAERVFATAVRSRQQAPAQAIRFLTTLTRVSLNRAGRLATDFFAALAKLPYLTSLELRECSLQPQNCSTLPKSLRHMSLHHVCYSRYAGSEKLWMQNLLLSAPQLESLRCVRSLGELGILQALRSLKSLELFEFDVSLFLRSEKMQGLLARLPSSLRVLNLTYFRAADRVGLTTGLKPGQLPHLHSVALCSWDFFFDDWKALMDAAPAVERWQARAMGPRPFLEELLKHPSLLSRMKSLLIHERIRRASQYMQPDLVNAILQKATKLKHLDLRGRMSWQGREPQWDVKANLETFNLSRYPDAALSDGSVDLSFVRAVVERSTRLRDLSFGHLTTNDVARHVADWKQLLGTTDLSRLKQLHSLKINGQQAGAAELGQLLSATPNIFFLSLTGATSRALRLEPSTSFHLPWLTEIDLTGTALEEDALAQLCTRTGRLRSLTCSLRSGFEGEWLASGRVDWSQLDRLHLSYDGQSERQPFFNLWRIFAAAANLKELKLSLGYSLLWNRGADYTDTFDELPAPALRMLKSVSLSEMAPSTGRKSVDGLLNELLVRAKGLKNLELVHLRVQGKNLPALGQGATFPCLRSLGLSESCEPLIKAAPRLESLTFKARIYLKHEREAYLGLAGQPPRFAVKFAY